jgi:hypothetical protein
MRLRKPIAPALTLPVLALATPAAAHGKSDLTIALAAVSIEVLDPRSSGAS